MIEMENFGPSTASVPAIRALQLSAPPFRREPKGAAVYRMLTGCHPSDAFIGDDSNFDRHVLASILSVAAADKGSVSERAGLAAADFASLMANWFPAAGVGIGWRTGDAAADDETAMVRDLLLSHRSSDGDAGRYLAAMIARRAMEPNHLWEDLGLRDRSELTRLLIRHFGPLAARNTNNMRWKRFFYRALCESDGFVMCTTPVCTACEDFELCFGDDSGESAMAERRRDVSQNAAFANPSAFLMQFSE